MLKLLKILIPFLLLCPTAHASFTIQNPIIAEGGSAKSTIGGVRAIGISTSTHFKVKSGFQYYDETAPYIDEVLINDGEAGDIDEQTSLDTICANWSGFKDPESGIHLLEPFDYIIRRASDDFLEFSGSATSTSVCVSGIGLQTSKTYYFSVRARNNIRMISEWADSDGVKIIPKLEFVLDSVSVNLGELDDSNDFTSTAETQIQVSTNAYHGYKINAWSIGPLTNTEFPSLQILDFYGTNEFPQEWSGVCEDNPNYCGFGYSTDMLEGDFAGWTQDAELVAEHEDHITGLTGEAINEISTITYKASIDDTTLSGIYKTTIIYVITPNY